MAGWRDIKAKARNVVHTTFEVPATYLTHMAGIPVSVLVRIHTGFNQPGEDFTSFEMSPRFEFEPYIIFRMSEVSNPAPRGLVVVDDTEIYRLGPSRPQREGYIEVDVTRLTKDELETTVPQLQNIGVLP